MFSKHCRAKGPTSRLHFLITEAYDLAPSLKTDKAKAAAVLAIVSPCFFQFFFSFLSAVLPDHTIYTFIRILRVAFKSLLQKICLALIFEDRFDNLHGCIGKTAFVFELMQFTSGFCFLVWAICSAKNCAVGCRQWKGDETTLPTRFPASLLGCFCLPS